MRNELARREQIVSYHGNNKEEKITGYHWKKLRQSLLKYCMETEYEEETSSF